MARAGACAAQPELAFPALDMVDALIYAALHMLLHHTRDIRHLAHLLGLKVVQEV